MTLWMRRATENIRLKNSVRSQAENCSRHIAFVVSFLFVIAGLIISYFLGTGIFYPVACIYHSGIFVYLISQTHYSY